MKSLLASPLMAILAIASPLITAANAQTLKSDISRLGLDTGGVQVLTLDAGPAHASEFYFLLGSASGTTPGQPLGTFTLPLNLDRYFLRTLFHPNTPPLSNSSGALSSPSGTATAAVALPSGLGPALVGVTLHHAFLAYQPATGLITHVSNTVPLSLVASTVPKGMTSIPAGSFEMGRHVGFPFADEVPLHTVTLDSFYMDVFETTNEQYRDFLNSAHRQGLVTVSSGVVYSAMGSEPYCNTISSAPESRIVWTGTEFTTDPSKLDHPMNEVSWYGAVAFANWRSAQDGLKPCYDLTTWTCNFSANGYRLPTESEWEYAARGGEHSPYFAYPWGNSVDGSNANYWASGDPFETGINPRTTPVGYYDGNQIPSGTDMVNGYGLYDISGNVREWTGDWHGLYSSSASTNPHGPSSGLLRVARGGSWWVGDTFLSCADRAGYLPEERDHEVGIRLARKARK